MRKHLISTLLVLVLSLNFVACGGSEGSGSGGTGDSGNTNTGSTGGIYGHVTDFVTGEDVANANVQLRPGGDTTLTGSDGMFEFQNLTSGDYSITVSKAGYTDLIDDYVITVRDRMVRRDVQLKKESATLRIVDDKGKDIDELDFGAEISDVSRQFNIFNDGYEKLEWELSFSADWIKSVSKDSGELKEGGTQGVIVNIDRSRLGSGENASTIHVTSNDGNKQLKVKATNDTVLPTLNTLEATEVRSSTAVLNAEILTSGVPGYSKRGFVYALESNPTLENTISDLTAAVTEENTYSAIATGLEMGETYYVRGYAINEAGVAYSTNQVKVVPQTVLASVMTKPVSNVNPDSESASTTFNGSIVDEGDPAYTERGFVYGTVHNPTVEDDTKKVATGSGTGDFSVNVLELEVSTVYYIRAYAINEKGIAYGSEVALNFENYLPYVSVPGTNLIVAKEDAGKAAQQTGKTMCNSISLAGFNDWRLPNSSSELQIIYNNKNFIGNFQNDWYWSSVYINGTGKGVAINLLNGEINGTANWANSYYIRCVRTAE